MIYKSLINRLKIIYKHDYEKFSKNARKEKVLCYWGWSKSFW